MTVEASGGRDAGTRGHAARAPRADPRRGRGDRDRRHRHAERLCLAGRLCRPGRLRHLGRGRRRSARSPRCWRPRARRACRSSICRTAGTRIMSRRAARARPTGTSRTRSRPCARGPSSQGKLLARGGWDYELVDALAPQPGDIVAPQDPLRAFFNSQLDCVLRVARHPQHRLRRHRHQRLRRIDAARRLPPRIFRRDAGGRDPPSRPRFHPGRPASTMSRNSSAGSPPSPISAARSARSRTKPMESDARAA